MEGKIKHELGDNCFIPAPIKNEDRTVWLDATDFDKLTLVEFQASFFMKGYAALYYVDFDYDFNDTTLQNLKKNSPSESNDIAINNHKISQLFKLKSLNERKAENSKRNSDTNAFIKSRDIENTEAELVELSKLMIEEVAGYEPTLIDNTSVSIKYRQARNKLSDLKGEERKKVKSGYIII